MKKFKALVMIMVMVMSLTGFTPTVEAKTKTSITVVNKATGKKVGKKVTLKTGEKLQLKVKYGKKNVTKKVKYKTSTKKVSVNKKGKITAKTAGTCTVKVTYKKKTKKIKVVVKAVETKTEESTEATTTKKAKHEGTISMDDIEKATRQKMAQCDHEWYPRFYSDIVTNGLVLPENYQDHLFLWGANCRKCGYAVRTVSVPFNEVWNCKNADFNNWITIPVTDVPCEASGASNHHYGVLYVPSGWSEGGAWSGRWDIDWRCTDCGDPKSW